MRRTRQTTGMCQQPAVVARSVACLVHSPVIAKAATPPLKASTRLAVRDRYNAQRARAVKMIYLHAYVLRLALVSRFAGVLSWSRRRCLVLESYTIAVILWKLVRMTGTILPSRPHRGLCCYCICHSRNVPVSLSCAFSSTVSISYHTVRSTRNGSSQN